MLISSRVLFGAHAEELGPVLCIITLPVPPDTAKSPPGQGGKATEAAGEGRQPGVCYRIKKGSLKCVCIGRERRAGGQINGKNLDRGWWLKAKVIQH